jgi:hypothetical protein
VIIIFGINRSGVFGGGIQYTEMKINRNFNAFTDLKSLELEVPTICLATGCVSLRRDRRYYIITGASLVDTIFCLILLK